MAAMLTYRMAQAMRNGAPRVFLAEIEHPDGTGYFWTGIGALDYDAKTWTGLGRLGGVTPITYTTDLQIQDVVFSVSGVNESDVARLSSDVRGYYGTLWIACLADDGKVISDPRRLAKVQFDMQVYRIDDDGKADIGIIGQPAFYNLTRSVNEVWSPERQKRLFPSDTGMDQVPEMQNKEIQWTRT